MNNENKDDFATTPGPIDPDQTNLHQSDNPDADANEQTADYRTSGSSPAASGDKPSENKSTNTTDKSTSNVPMKVGRYAIKRLLGRGGFGEVYLGFDDQLQRDVAIKLTFGSRVGPKATRMFMAEARMLAELDHPNIVPVFDIGTTDKGDIYIVSKLIDGTDLATRIEKDRPSRELALEIIGAIAEALHYAHSTGLIHRDIKPANILLDKTDRPYLADFGIALRETDQVGSGEITGTPAYMSPEQARGEGHLMSNQSDIYSLGLVLYELLAGRRPYRGKTAQDLLRMAQIGEVRTPRTFDVTITKELERVCLKALARRPSDRYAIAKDFAEEVRLLVANQLASEPNKRNTSSAIGTGTGIASGAVGQSALPTPSDHAKLSGIESDQQFESVKITPRGLRSFEPKDSEFFLELLPGPFDRFGLPESLRFWKDRIESTQIEESFRIGLVYGPSGCGKSSLMKAGLLPRLSPKIERVYVEATPEDTPARLLKEIQKTVLEAAKNNLVETLNLIRRRKLVPSGGKLLLVIDQFEQWLHSHDEYAGQELTDALRQCDGVTVQAVLMVRDDFWLSVSRFLKELDVRIQEGENAALVDLFDLDHAKRVLGLFGQAYERLDQDRSKWTEPQKQFLETAVEGLAENRKVISVRLALFAEMLKSRDWVPKSIQDVGGVAGVGVTFLEETFGDKHAPIQIRKHQGAVRDVLSALLPSTGTNIKGYSRSLLELQKSVGYENKPSEFTELISLLDKNLRLITPADESGQENRSYQLTHDYLVPSLRDWLNQKQRETKKGRAELKLAERAATWGANQENKQLPTLWEWMSIKRLTEFKRWTDGEQRLMRSAGRYHVARMGSLLASICLIGILGFLGWQRISNQRSEDAAAATAESWLKLESSKLGELLPRLRDQSTWIKDDLQRAAEDPQTPADLKSRALIGLNIIDEIRKDQWSAVTQTMLRQPIDDFLALCKLLKDSKDQLTPSFQSKLTSPESTNEEKLLVAAGLALYDPDCEPMLSTDTGRMIADGIAKTNPIYLKAWQDAFEPISERLIPILQDRFADPKSSEVQKNLVATVLADYSKTNSDRLAQLISISDPASYQTFFNPIKSLGSNGIASLQSIASRELKPQWNDPASDPTWKEVDSAVKLSFQQAQGMISDRFAYVQAMPLEKFLETAEALRPCGYRPTRVRPWAWSPRANSEGDTSTEGPMVAAIFTRDSKKWEIETNLKMAQIPKGDQPAVKGELVLEDLCAMPTRSTLAPSFIALWVEPASDKDIRRVLVDIDEDELRTENNKIGETSGSIRATVRSKRGGTRRYTVIYSELVPPTDLYSRHQGGQLLYRPQTDIAMAQPRQPVMTAVDTAKSRVASFDALSESERRGVLKNAQLLNIVATAMLATKEYQRALDLCNEGLTVNADSPDLQLSRLLALVRLKQTEQVANSVKQVVPLLESPSFKAYAQIQASYLTDGKDSAMELIQRYRQELKGDLEELYNVLCASALCADAASEGEKKDFIDAALDLLDFMVTQGYANTTQLTSDADLAILHREPRFIAALNRIDVPQPNMGIWGIDTTIETRVIPEDPTAAARGWIDGKRIDELIAQGWRPTAIALGDWGADSDPRIPYGSMILSRPLIPDELKELTAKEQAHAILALYELGDKASVWSLLKRCPPDARVRSYFQAYLTDYGADPETIVKAFLERSPDSTPMLENTLKTNATAPSTAALAISLGDFQQAKMLSEDQQVSVRAHALKLFVEDIDSGVHGACEWLLKQLGAQDELQTANKELATGTVVGNRNWYRTKRSKDTFIVLGPAEFVMGSPIHESEGFGRAKEPVEAQHVRGIDYRFAIASQETTVEQFQRFRANHSIDRINSRESDAPANQITWFDAVAYCNWLSKSEGLAPEEYCYQINPQDPTDVAIPPDMLKRIGYRLPTEAEWEFACRAHSITARPYGETKELLGRFAWYADNSGTERAISVGTMRPNDIGMFDMLGNIWEWNQDSGYWYPKDKPGKSTGRLQIGKVDPKERRLLRGGSFGQRALHVRSSNRNFDDPTTGFQSYGFRPSRTYR
jgi:serine/threonine protein kinase/formylglycine-generating enzyme required for sulfatase activity